MGLFDKPLGKKAEKGESVLHSPSAVASKAKDPVCGMEVDPKTAPAKSEYMGKAYYFCSPGCKKRSMQTQPNIPVGKRRLDAAASTTARQRMARSPAVGVS